jgi:hypothetical protein
MKRNRSTASFFGDLVSNGKSSPNRSAGIHNHVPAQLGDFGRAQASLHREQNNQAVAKRMPRALGEKQKIVDVISR